LKKLKKIEEKTIFSGFLLLLHVSSLGIRVWQSERKEKLRIIDNLIQILKLVIARPSPTVFIFKANVKSIKEINNFNF